MKQKFFWLKLIGAAFLLHVALIVLSIIEVAVYSYLINPGHDTKFYSEHAKQSGPWISTIFGPLLIFFLVKRFISRFSSRQLTYALALPIIYTILDYLIFAVSGAGADAFAFQFIISHIIKISAGLLAYFVYFKNQKKRAH
jgi:hypothetical protein